MAQDGEILFLVLSYLQQTVPNAEGAISGILNTATSQLPRRIDFNGKSVRYCPGGMRDVDTFAVVSTCTPLNI